MKESGGRIVARVAIGVLALLVGAELFVGFTGEWGMYRWFGHDYELYMRATRSWLDGGPFYHPFQLSGPYPIVRDEILYPPHTLLLLVPFTALPPLLWWAIPLGVLAWAYWRARPGIWMWAFVLACLAIPKTVLILTNGNPTLWVAAGLALGAPAAVLLKPTLAPLALLGVRSSRFWIATAGFVLVDVVLLDLTRQYVTVVRNATNGSLLYSLGDIGMIGIGLVPWLVHRERRDHARRLDSVRPARARPGPAGPHRAGLDARARSRSD